MISARLKLALVVLAPVVVSTVVGVGRPLVVGRLDDASLTRRAEDLSAAFENLLARTALVARVALDESSPAASRVPLPAPLADRLEGVGVLEADLTWVDWSGRPADPPNLFGHAAWPAWSVSVEGARTRLLVRAGPDASGRMGLASFLLDSTLGEFAFSDLFPSDLLRGTRLDTVFRDHAAGYGETRDGQDAASASGERAVDTVPLRAPDGSLLAVARIGRGEGRARSWSYASAWGVLTFVLLVGAFVNTRRLSESTPGILAVLGGLAAARALVALSWAPAVLLPRTLGSPSVYGTTAAWRLFRSPADLLLTGVVIWIACVAVARYARIRWNGGLAATFFTILGAAMATATGLRLSLSLVEDSSAPMLDWPAPFAWDARLVAWTGFSLVLLGAAELWACAWSCVLRSGRSRASPTAVAVALLPIAVAGTLLLQSHSERIAVERLGSEYAPEILEQESLRMTALRSALFEVRDFFEGEETLGLLARPDFLAYRFWVEGGLAHAGYQSSLDFFSPDGQHVSHFDFDLPPFLGEPLAPVVEAEGPPWNLRMRTETIPIGIAVEKRLLHGQVPVVRGEETLGVVVGHVLDEPENLPFLPRSRLYLSALGRGLPPETGDSIAGGPEYVLYDANGAIELSTLDRPPADAPHLHTTAEDDDPVYVTAGDEPHVGLALADDDGRLHLLLVPRPTLLERIASSARIVTLGLVLIALTAWGRAVARRRRAGDELQWLRGSFHRRLFVWMLIPSLALLFALAAFIVGYLERRADNWLILSATQVVSAAQRVVEDYTALQLEEESGLDDSILYWLSDVVGQDIHVYANGALEASSKRELFRSGILPSRLDGDVYRRLRDEGLPYDVQTERIGPATIPVAYAPIRLGADPAAHRVIAVPLVLERQQIDRAIDRIAATIFLATVALVAVLALVALLVARTVARPVSEMVAATERVARGDYGARLRPRTRDELAHLVESFNAMGAEIEKQRTALERQRDYRETLLRHATTGVLSLDADGKLVTLNPAAVELLALGEVRPREGEDLARTLRGSDVLAPLARALVAAPPGEAVEVDLQQDGTPRRIRFVRVELEGSGDVGVGTLVLLDDVTDMMRSSQLAAWAEMARAIAHEIKNPLTPIQLSTEHVRRLLADRGVFPAPQVEACLDTIIKQVRSLHDIAGAFSAYAKLPDLDLQPADPVAFMRSCVGPYRVGSPPGLTIEERYEAAPTVSIDDRILSRAVVNLIENALHAMADGGILTVGVSRDSATGSAVLSVSDTGPGLGPEVRTRLFEPYFSTKSSGTGLGLAIARRAVEAHNGTIEFESRHREGTVFRIRLPAAIE